MPEALLTSPEYYGLLARYLVPMFPGAGLDPAAIPVAISDSMVTQETGESLLIRPDARWPYCFRMTREHPFEPDNSELATQFVEALGEKLVASDQPFFGYLVTRCAQEVVTRSVQHRVVDDGLLPMVITTMQSWASQTYEGSRISVAIGVDPKPDPKLISNIHLRNCIDHDFAKVLTNGMDTVLVLSPSGHIVEHRTLDSDSRPSKKASNPSFAPLRYGPLAAWSKGPRVALVLNPHGEVLVFTAQQLKFAYRRGTWFHFPHKSFIERMDYLAIDNALKRAVYVTCMDVSFSRTGGCVAVVTKENAAKLESLLSPDDMLAKTKTEKTSLLHHVIGKPFHKLPRLARQEVAALDGAIVLDQEGQILAAGAIVRVPAGSDGGGRRAAAKALSRLGFSVKISEDGGVTAFTEKGPRRSPDIAFEVCV